MTAGAVEASMTNPRLGMTKSIDECHQKKKCGQKKAVQFPDMEQQLENACSFVVLLCESPACFDHRNERFCACDFVRRLAVESWANSVQNLKAHFVLKKENRTNQIQKVTAAGEGRRRSQKKCEKSEFLAKQRKLTFCDSLGNDTDLLCKASVKKLLGFGHVAWKTLVKGAKASVGKETQHGVVGQTKTSSHWAMMVQKH